MYIDERSTAGINDRADRAIRLCFLQRGTEVICAGIGVKAKGAGAVINSTLIGEYEDGKGREVFQEVAMDCFKLRRGVEKSAVFQEGHHRANALGHFGGDLTVVPGTTDLTPQLFCVFRSWHFHQGRNRIHVRW